MADQRIDYARQLKNVSPLDVRTFGAIGDGAHDDSAAIQAAINAVGISSGGIYLPPGNYKSQGLIIPDNYTNFSIRGAGSFQSTLINPSTIADVITWNNPVGYPIGLYDFGVEGQTAATAGWGIKLGNSIFGSIDNLHVRNIYNGVYLKNCNSLLVSNVIGYDIQKIGLHIDGNAGTAVSIFINLHISTHGHLAETNSDTAALYLTTSNGGTIAGPTFTGCQFLAFGAAVLAICGAGLSLNEVTLNGGGITGHIYGLRIIAANGTAYSWRLNGIQYIASLSRDAVINGPAISIDQGVSRFSVTDSTIESGSPNFQTVDIMGSSLVDISSNTIIQDGTGAEITIRKGGAFNASHITIKNNKLGYKATLPVSGTGAHAIETTADPHDYITIQNNDMYGSTAALSFLATGLGSLIQNNNPDPASGAPGKPAASAAIEGSTWLTKGSAGVASLDEVCVRKADNSFAWVTRI